MGTRPLRPAAPKGVLHRHFADFDAFLADFVQDRVNRLDPQTAALGESAGTGTVADNLTNALTALFSSVAVAIVPLITFRDELRARLRDTWPAGVPVLTEAATIIAIYLTIERGLGRLKPDADVDTLAPTLIGAGHLLFADRTGTPPGPRHRPQDGDHGHRQRQLPLRSGVQGNAMATKRTPLGKVQPYLGRCTATEALANRDRFGGVTLQGTHGLKLASTLAKAGELNGIDLDPAVYLTRPKVTAQLGLDLDLPAFNWVAAQAELGLPIVRTPGERIRTGHVDHLVRTLDQEHPTPVSVTLVLDGGWLGSKHSGVLAERLRAADRDVSLVLGAPLDPIDSSLKVMGLRRLLRWSLRTGRRLELLRTGPIGIPAVAAGARLAAIGLSSSTRHLGGPLVRRTNGTRPRRSPQVFIPRLLHWQRGAVLGGLRGAGLTDCDCPACAVTGRDLGRFDVSFDSAVPAEVRTAAKEHDSHALAALVRSVTSADDPRAELERLRQDAQDLAEEVALAVPTWLGKWD